MKQLILISILSFLSLTIQAQKSEAPFRAYLYNNEYEVFLHIDFYDETITVPGQELYGQLPGYLGKKNNSFCWVITSATIRHHQRSNG